MINILLRDDSESVRNQGVEELKKLPQQRKIFAQPY